jgi:hypothetical protein
MNQMAGTSHIVDMSVYVPFIEAVEREEERLTFRRRVCFGGCLLLLAGSMVGALVILFFF